MKTSTDWILFKYWRKKHYEIIYGWETGMVLRKMGEKNKMKKNQMYASKSCVGRNYSREVNSVNNVSCNQAS